MAPWPVQSAPLKTPDNNSDKRTCNGPRCSMNDKNNCSKPRNSGVSTRENLIAESFDPNDYEEEKLKLLLEEIVTYKNPPDRIGKSEAFQALLSKEENEEAEKLSERASNGYSSKYNNFYGATTLGNGHDAIIGDSCLASCSNSVSSINDKRKKKSKRDRSKNGNRTNSKSSKFSHSLKINPAPSVPHYSSQSMPSKGGEYSKELITTKSIKMPICTVAATSSSSSSSLYKVNSERPYGMSDVYILEPTSVAQKFGDINSGNIKATLDTDDDDGPPSSEDKDDEIYTSEAKLEITDISRNNNNDNADNKSNNNNNTNSDNLNDNKSAVEMTMENNSTNSYRDNYNSQCKSSFMDRSIPSFFSSSSSKTSYGLDLANRAYASPEERATSTSSFKNVLDEKKDDNEDEVSKIDDQEPTSSLFTSSGSRQLSDYATMTDVIPRDTAVNSAIKSYQEQQTISIFPRQTIPGIAFLSVSGENFTGTFGRANRSNLDFKNKYNEENNSDNQGSETSKSPSRVDKMKARRMKKNDSRQERPMLAESINGYCGDKSINDILNYIEYNRRPSLSNTIRVKNISDVNSKLPTISRNNNNHKNKVIQPKHNKSKSTITNIQNGNAIDDDDNSPVNNVKEDDNNNTNRKIINTVANKSDRDIIDSTIDTDLSSISKKLKSNVDDKSKEKSLSISNERDKYIYNGDNKTTYNNDNDNINDDDNNKNLHTAVAKITINSNSDKKPISVIDSDRKEKLPENRPSIVDNDNSATKNNTNSQDNSGADNGSTYDNDYNIDVNCDGVLNTTKSSSSSSSSKKNNSVKKRKENVQNRQSVIVTATNDDDVITNKENGKNKKPKDDILMNHNDHTFISDNEDGIEKQYDNNCLSDNVNKADVKRKNKKSFNDNENRNPNTNNKTATTDVSPDLKRLTDNDDRRNNKIIVGGCKRKKPNENIFRDTHNDDDRINNNCNSTGVVGGTDLKSKKNNKHSSSSSSSSTTIAICPDDYLQTRKNQKKKYTDVDNNAVGNLKKSGSLQDVSSLIIDGKSSLKNKKQLSVDGTLNDFNKSIATKTDSEKPPLSKRSGCLNNNGNSIKKIASLDDVNNNSKTEKYAASGKKNKKQSSLDESCYREKYDNDDKNSRDDNEKFIEKKYVELPTATLKKVRSLEDINRTSCRKSKKPIQDNNVGGIDNKRRKSKICNRGRSLENVTRDKKSAKKRTLYCDNNSPNNNIDQSNNINDDRNSTRTTITANTNNAAIDGMVNDIDPVLLNEHYAAAALDNMLENYGADEEFHLVTKKNRRKKKKFEIDQQQNRENNNNTFFGNNNNNFVGGGKSGHVCKHRRKSISSTPPHLSTTSDKASDSDSVHSLPPSSKCRKNVRQRRNLTKEYPTPQTSYADIAKSLSTQSDNDDKNNTNVHYSQQPNVTAGNIIVSNADSDAIVDNNNTVNRDDDVNSSNPSVTSSSLNVKTFPSSLSVCASPIIIISSSSSSSSSSGGGSNTTVDNSDSISDYSYGNDDKLFNKSNSSNSDHHDNARSSTNVRTGNSNAKREKHSTAVMKSKEETITTVDNNRKTNSSRDNGENNISGDNLVKGGRDNVNNLVVDSREDTCCRNEIDKRSSAVVVSKIDDDGLLTNGDIDFRTDENVDKQSHQQQSDALATMSDSVITSLNDSPKSAIITDDIDSDAISTDNQQSVLSEKSVNGYNVNEVLEYIKQSWKNVLKNLSVANVQNRAKKVKYFDSQKIAVI